MIPYVYMLLESCMELDSSADGLPFMIKLTWRHNCHCVTPKPLHCRISLNKLIKYIKAHCIVKEAIILLYRSSGQHIEMDI